MPGPTLQDVARKARVSTATVSRVLNAPEVVKAQTRESVEAAIADLGYTPHFGGRALASNRTNTIGVVIPTMENAIFARGLQALEDELSQSGITLLVATSHYSVEREGQQIKALLARGIDGLALIGEARPESTYGLLKKSGVPVVLLWTGQSDRDFPHLGFDNRGAARAMTELVLDEGHKVIAMLAGPTDGNDRAADRVLGVQDALKARGMTLPPGYLIESPYDLEQSAMAAARLLSLDPRPTALICGNDVIAAGAISGARRSGQNVPQDVSVVGYDDIDLAIAVEPQLTTVRVPHQRMGQAAAKTLHRLIGGEIPAKNQIFDFQIIRRSSLARAG
ncbi:MAG: LacI family DNA-binding transcriptional regulator [Pseudomonadota bacterium]